MRWRRARRVHGGRPSVTAFIRTLICSLLHRRTGSQVLHCRHFSTENYFDLPGPLAGFFVARMDLSAALMAEFKKKFDDAPSV